MLFLIKATSKMRKENDTWSLLGCSVLEAGWGSCKKTAVVNGCFSRWYKWRVY